MLSDGSRQEMLEETPPNFQAVGPIAATPATVPWRWVRSTPRTTPWLNIEPEPLEGLVDALVGVASRKHSAMTPALCSQSRVINVVNFRRPGARRQRGTQIRALPS